MWFSTSWPCHETIYDAYNAVALGYGPTDRLKDGVILPSTPGVNLGFNKAPSFPIRIAS
jgi:hypothetical protein